MKGRRYPIQDLANMPNRDVSAVRKDVNKLEQYVVLRSERTTVRGHGIVCIVSAPSSITFQATV
jgi:predicted transcriptional regulator